jgi:uncharacterized membrane protein YccC
MVSQFQHLLNWLHQQFQLKPGKPYLISSLRILLSVLVPLAVGVLVGHPVSSAIAIISAWFVGMVNVEGVYRQKATAKVIALVSITAMLFLANLVHGTLWLAAPTTFVVMFIAGLAGVLGQAAASTSLFACIMFVVALARFATASGWSALLLQCGLCLAGGMWSITVSLGIWKFRPYRPVIQSVADCYSALSQLVDAAKGRIARLDDRRAQLDRFLQTQDNLAQALTTARNRWSSAWTAQQSANPAANQLLILIEDASQMANAVVGLVERVVIASNHPLFLRVQADLEQTMAQIASAVQQMSELMLRDWSTIPADVFDPAIANLKHQLETLQNRLDQNTIAPALDDFPAFTSLETITETLIRLTDQVQADAELIINLQPGTITKSAKLASRPTELPSILPDQEPTPVSALATLRNNLTLQSTLFRHALRLAIVATVAEVIASLLPIPRGYWVTLTAVVALKPNYGGTAQTTIQRVLGTLIGGAIGIALLMLIHNPWLMGGWVLALLAIAVAVRPLSFSLFVTLLTPAIILLLNVTSHGGWQVGVARIADSLLGGVLALMGSYLLFPRWERQQLPTQLGKTLQANLAYFQQVITTYFHPNEEATVAAIAPLYRHASLENTNLGASAQRLFSEPRHIQGDVEPITTVIYYIRRFFNSVTVLTEQRQKWRDAYQCPDFKQFSDKAIQVLENLISALHQQQAPPPLPDLDRHLVAIRAHTEQLAASRTNRATAPDNSPAPSQIFQERTSVTAVLAQIAYEIKNIHGAIALLPTQSKAAHPPEASLQSLPQLPTQPR